MIPFIFPGFYTLVGMGGLAAFFIGLILSVGRNDKPINREEKQ